MGLPDRKYSDEQRVAMLHVRKQGHSYAETAEILSRLGCPELEVEPFDAPAVTIRGIVPAMLRREAGSKPIEGPPDQAIDALIQRMAALVDAELATMESRQGTLDVKRLDDLSKIAARLRVPTRPKLQTPGPDAEPGDQGDDPEPERSPFEQQLAADRPSQEGDDVQAEADPSTPLPPLGPGPATTATALDPATRQHVDQGAHDPIPQSRDEHASSLVRLRVADPA